MRDNYTLALPILKYHRARLFFHPNILIEEQRLGWWDVIAYLIKQTTRSFIEIDNVRVPVRGNRADAIQFFLGRMKLEPSNKNESLQLRLSEACGVRLPSLDVQDAKLMTWDQIREAYGSGVAIGSHTHSHRVLATLDETAQHEELARSKRILEDKLGAKVRSLAYPVGGYAHFTESNKRIARDCGYKIAFSFNAGVNDRKRISAFDVKRVGASRELSLVSAAATFPRVFVARAR